VRNLGLLVRIHFGSNRRFIAFIDDADVVERILRHLNLVYDQRG
jgi:hypothetical protein